MVQKKVKSLGKCILKDMTLISLKIDSGICKLLI